MANSRLLEAVPALVDRALQGDRRSIARLISRVEDGGPEAWSALSLIYPRTGRAQIIGVTGAPGTGKSTLVGEIAKLYRKSRPAPTVGIVAVDPTSPFSGGAVLGDRIRMRDLSGDEGVFIRSMATRGSLGGLARSTTDVVKVLDAAGFDVIVIETVGAGQSEIEVARTADTVIVVEAPGLGDEVQAIKAGILEIADILVVNKADRDGVQNTINALHAMLDLGKSRPYPTPHGGVGGPPGAHHVLHHGVLMQSMPETSARSDARWQPPIFKTIASQGQGVTEVIAAVAHHRTFLAAQPEGQQRARLRAAIELETILRETLLDRLLQSVGADRLNALIDQVVARTIDPYSAADQLQRAAVQA